jgi:hypothetical protein
MRGMRDSHPGIPSGEAGGADSCAVSAHCETVRADSQMLVPAWMQGYSVCAPVGHVLLLHAWRSHANGVSPLAQTQQRRRSGAASDSRSDDQVAMECRPRRAAVAERPARSRCWARVFAFAEGFRSYFSSGSVLDQQSVAVQCVRRKRRQEHPGC